jgi:hypothetical protein
MNFREFKCRKDVELWIGILATTEDNKTYNMNKTYVWYVLLNIDIILDAICMFR